MNFLLIRILWQVIFLASCLGTSLSVSMACDCAGPGSPGQAYKQSDAVFVGKVIGHKKMGSIRQGERFIYQEPTYTFNVKKAWKGIKTTTVEILTGGGCGYYGFVEGQEFLVYAYGTSALEASMCGRTKPLENVDLEMKILDLVSEGGKEETLMGQLSHYLLENPHESIRAEAAQMLGAHAPKEIAFSAAPALIQALEDKSPRVKQAVIGAFDRGPWIWVDENTPKIGKALIKSLSDPKPLVRRDAARVLSRFRSVPETVPALQLALRTEQARENPNREVITAISSSLATIGGGASKQEAIPFLIQDLKNSDNAVRQNAAEKLGKIGPQAISAVPALLEVLQDPNEWVRYYSAEALGSLGSQDSVPGLIAALHDPSLGVRAQAAFSIYRIGDNKFLKEAAIPALY